MFPAAIKLLRDEYGSIDEVGLRPHDLGRDGIEGEQSSNRKDQGGHQGDPLSEGPSLCGSLQGAVPCPVSPLRSRQGKASRGDGHLLRESPSRSGRVLDPRSSSGQGLSERPIGESKDRALASRQKESKVENSDPSSLRNLWRGVLIQAFRDFCSSEQEAGKVLLWLRSDASSLACEACGADFDKVLSTFEFLERYDFPLRKNIMKETIAATLGGTRVEWGKRKGELQGEG